MDTCLCMLAVTYRHISACWPNSSRPSQHWDQGEDMLRTSGRSQVDSRAGNAGWEWGAGSPGVRRAQVLRSESGRVGGLHTANTTHTPASGTQGRQTARASGAVGWPQDAGSSALLLRQPGRIAATPAQAGATPAFRPEGAGGGGHAAPFEEICACSRRFAFHTTA